MARWAIVVALLLGATAARAGHPIVLRIVGRLATSRATAPGTIAALALEIRGDKPATLRWLGVTDARTLPRENPVAGQNLAEALPPLGGRLRLFGPPALLARLRQAPVGSRVTIEGSGFAGDPNLLVTRVAVVEPSP
jgi:hypothetical protein